MAKRFIDTGLFRKKWIRELDCDMKLFWVYLLTDCDHAGIWDVDVERAAFQLNAELTESKILETFNKKIVPFKKDKWFVPKFIEYQYGELNENIRPHQSVIKILQKYKLYKGFTSPLQTPKVKNTDKKQDQLKKISSELDDLQKEFKQREVVKEFEKFKDFAYGKICGSKDYPNDYQLKQSSCCGVEWTSEAV
jgi:hypothetical protein